jgi:outer membrane protein
MKGTSLIVSIILFVAIAVLYVLHFTGKNHQPEIIQPRGGVTGGIKVAFVKTDSLIMNYDLAQDLHNEFTKKQEAYTNEYTTKRTSFEKDAADFQEKVNRGGFLTEQRAIQERDRLASRQEEIVKLDQELSTKLADLQATNNKQLLDSIINYLTLVNKSWRYDYIFNAADILIGDETNNITSEVLVGLNARYSKTKLGR